MDTCTAPPKKIPLWKIPLYLIAIPQGGISTSLHATSADTEAHRRTKRAYDRNAAMEAPVIPFIYDSQLAGGSWLYDSDPLGGLRGYRIFGAAATALTSGYSSSSSLDE